MELREKRGVTLRRKLATHNEQMSKLPRTVCSKFYQLCFCQILFEFFYNWESYRKIRKVNLFLRHSVCSCLRYTPGSRTFTQIGIFDLFGFRDLDLDSVTFTYELDPYF